MRCSEHRCPTHLAREPETLPANYPASHPLRALSYYDWWEAFLDIFVLSLSESKYRTDLLPVEALLDIFVLSLSKPKYRTDLLSLDPPSHPRGVLLNCRKPGLPLAPGGGEDFRYFRNPSTGPACPSPLERPRNTEFVFNDSAQTAKTVETMTSSTNALTVKTMISSINALTTAGSQANGTSAFNGSAQTT